MRNNMLKIYANPKCSKSRKVLEVLNREGIHYEEIHYLEKKLSPSEILILAQAANLKVIDLIRKKEDVFSELNIEWEKDELAAQAIVNNPILLERPIASLGNKAMIVRSDEAIEELIRQLL
tara:strand:+ start:32030 stop:32392 length:363 start_codon:yes stop_codon:yes gene_type:complete